VLEINLSPVVRASTTEEIRHREKPQTAV